MDGDELISVLPIHYSNSLSPNVHIHQFPLLSRPLQTPPAAAVSGKRIRARIKPITRRLEIHVPVDPRPEVWNGERSKELGAARQEDDREKNQDVGKMKQMEGEEPRLIEARMRSELIPQEGAYMLGVVRNGQLHLQPISETHQFRPTLTYLDIMSRKSRRSRGDAGSDEDSDDGPPPDPDEPPPIQTTSKKEKKPLEVKEVQVSARKAADDKGNLQGGLSAVRREMLLAIRAEEDEVWEDLDFCDGETAEGHEAFEAVFSQNEEHLECNSDITAFLKGIKGL
ncbi:DNA-directed RNA polymerase III subunit Rpc5 [Suillus subaureus]|uniref:DNA-directed RNA polymerase III subunit Rpc5 n=1 Tax=Suillus subaureus TaxID=48587 RepID=A0A9P7JJJ6_9AGAM|nr:DNA-directed RNA polymerase III subunit Rpc5 [Suillus subaureus]KAG1826092.1 DNA-directed RNA polymerase III subunit Rpc5 [Suillus subaureus]